MFHSRLCLLNEGAAAREPSHSCSNDNGEAAQSSQQSLGNKWELARSCRKWPCFLAILEPRFKRYAYPLPAYCLLIACSRGLVTILILNEIRLYYSPLYAGFAYKTTEQLWHWGALSGCSSCCSCVLISDGRSGNCARVARWLYKLVLQLGRLPDAAAPSGALWRPRLLFREQRRQRHSACPSSESVSFGGRNVTAEFTLPVVAAKRMRSHEDGAIRSCL
jgi:hypothetical protein